MQSARPWTRFGRVLRDLRAARSLSQVELAERCLLDQTTISLLERNERQPTLPTLYRISNALELTIIELLEELEKENSEE